MPLTRTALPVVVKALMVTGALPARSSTPLLPVNAPETTAESIPVPVPVLKVSVSVKPPVLMEPVMRLRVPLPLPLPLMVNTAFWLAALNVLLPLRVRPYAKLLLSKLPGEMTVVCEPMVRAPLIRCVMPLVAAAVFTVMVSPVLLRLMAPV